MYYCNDFYSLSVLSLYEGELLGMVNKLIFDKKLKKLMQIELLTDEGVKLILPVKNIYNIGKNAITIKNNQAVNLKIEDENLANCPIGSKAYSIQGEYLGFVKEITFNKKFVTEKIILDNSNSLDVSLLASSGKNTVIFYDNNKKINMSKFLPAQIPSSFKNNTPQQAEILPSENTNIEIVGTIEQQAKTQNFEFLLGRICTKDILNFNNEILIKANSTVTKKNLKEINRFGKLRELMLFLK